MLVFKIIAVVILDGNPLLLLKRISEIRTMTTARSHSLGTIVKFFYIVVKTGIGIEVSLCVFNIICKEIFFISKLDARTSINLLGLDTDHRKKRVLWS